VAKKKRHTTKFKSAVALEAAKEIKTLNELASLHGIHSAQISMWKKQLLECGEGILIPQRKNAGQQNLLVLTVPMIIP